MDIMGLIFFAVVIGVVIYGLYKYITPADDKDV